MKSIILFGSVARGEAKKESDIDIFVDVFRNEEKISKKVDKIKEDFYESIKFTKFWILQKYEGIKLGKGAIEIPLESYQIFMKLFREYKIPVKIKYVILE